VIACLLLAPSEALLADLYAFTNRLGPFDAGVFLDVSDSDARRIARAYRARVGSAETQEAAHLLALLACAGQVNKDIETINSAPLETLLELGTSPQAIERFEWLGLACLGDLKRWRKTQLSAYLGDEAKIVSRYLKGPFTKTVAVYKPALSLSESYSFDDPVTEPWQLTPVLSHLSDCLMAALGDKAAARLSLSALAQGLTFKHTVIAKTVLKGQAVNRLAEVALLESGALGFGIDTLTVELTGLYRPTKQLGLWQQREELAKAVSLVEARFPQALLKLTEADPYTPIAEFAYELSPLTGSGVKRELSFGAFSRGRGETGATRSGERRGSLVHR